MNVSSLRSMIVVLGALLLHACAAEPARGHLYAQRGAMTCTQDGDCARRMRLPRPRACPNGAQSTPTACCRMGYCGICWSECGR